MTNLIVVGGSKFQFPLVEAAQRLGMSVVCVDGNINCFCSNVEGVKFIHSDISNVEKCLRLLQGYPIINAVTAQSDAGVILVEELKNMSNRNDSNVFAAHIFTYKGQFKNYLKNISLTKSAFKVFGREKPFEEIYVALDTINMPVAVKPSDSSGSRGVTKVDNKSDLKEAVELAFQYSKKGEIVVESWLEGHEFGAQVLVNEVGDCQFLHHTDYLFNNVPVAHAETHANEFLENKIRLIVQDLRIKNVILNVDAIATDEDVEILEIGMRLGATDIFKLANEKYNINIFENIILDNFDLRSNHSAEKLYGILYNPTERIFRKLKKCPLKKININGIQLSIELDQDLEMIKPLHNGTDRFGSFTTQSQELELDNIMAEILSTLCRLEIVEEADASEYK